MSSVEGSAQLCPGDFSLCQTGVRVKSSAAGTGFAAVSGTEIDLDPGGVPTGGVKRHFDEWDKLEFVASHCDANDIDLAECIAVGDSRSDVPLFEAVGFSIALNATPQAREVASVAFDTENLIDILDLIPWE